MYLGQNLAATEHERHRIRSQHTLCLGDYSMQPVMNMPSACALGMFPRLLHVQAALLRAHPVARAWPIAQKPSERSSMQVMTRARGCMATARVRADEREPAPTGSAMKVAIGPGVHP